MTTTDGPAALRMLAGDFELTKAACWNESDTASMWTLAAAWESERQACQSAVEEADRLRFAAEAQAAADRAALAQARAETANLRDALQDLYDDWQGPSTSSLVAARAALRLGGAR